MRQTKTMPVRYSDFVEIILIEMIHKLVNVVIINASATSVSIFL